MSIWKSTSPELMIAAAPPLALATCGLLLALGVPPLPEWFWPTPTTNIAEAAALGDAARVRALAANGAPVNAPLPVRGMISGAGAPASMTPLEAAIRYRGQYVVPVLLELGVRLSADEAYRLACLAIEADLSDAAARIQEGFAVARRSCEPDPDDATSP